MYAWILSSVRKNMNLFQTLWFTHELSVYEGIRYDITSDVNFRSCGFGCRVDVVIFVIWELIILSFLVFSAVSLYFRHMQLAFILVCITLLLLLCMKVTKQVRLARKKKRRMLLPLSMWKSDSRRRDILNFFYFLNSPNYIHKN